MVQKNFFWNFKAYNVGNPTDMTHSNAVCVCVSMGVCVRTLCVNESKEKIKHYFVTPCQATSFSG